MKFLASLPYHASRSKKLISLYLVTDLPHNKKGHV